MGLSREGYTSAISILIGALSIVVLVVTLVTKSKDLPSRPKP